MRLNNYLNEVYMSKALSADLDKSRSKSKPKFSIMIDGFEQETAKTIKRANTLKAEWIKWYMRNNKATRAEAESAVTIVKT